MTGNVESRGGGVQLQHYAFDSVTQTCFWLDHTSFNTINLHLPVKSQKHLKMITKVAFFKCLNWCGQTNEGTQRYANVVKLWILLSLIQADTSLHNHQLSMIFQLFIPLFVSPLFVMAPSNNYYSFFILRLGYSPWSPSLNVPFGLNKRGLWSVILKVQPRGQLQPLKECSVVVKNIGNKMESHCSLRYYRGRQIEQTFSDCAQNNFISGTVCFQAAEDKWVCNTSYTSGCIYQTS